MNQRRLNHGYLLILAALTGVALTGIAVIIFVLENWWARIGAFFGVGAFVLLVSMGVTFWFGGLANRSVGEPPSD